MKRRLFCQLAPLPLVATILSLPSHAAPTPASNPGKMVIAVIAADKDSTYAMAESVRRVRDSNNFSKNLIPIARIPATDLKKEDFERIGFSAQSLPVVALMKISSAENLDSVWGNPPAIVRNVTKAEVAAQIILCRWAEFASVKLPPSLESVARIYQPFKIFILNSARDAETLDKTAQELVRLKAAEKITDQDLPVLSLIFGEGIMTSEDYTRLGFGPDALPAVCLVKMSDCGNPTTIVGDTGLLRWSYSSPSVAREVLRQWSRLKNLPLKTIPSSEAFAIDNLAWADPQPKFLPNQTVKFHYQAHNFRFGPEARVWLQEEARILNADGSQVPNLGGQSNHRWPSLPGTNLVDLDSSITTPAKSGKYLLEITTRDKQGNARGQLSLPLEI